MTLAEGVRKPMSHLFDPLQLGSLRRRLRNRIVIAPMCQYSASDGAPGDGLPIHLGHLAWSGAGLMVREALGLKDSPSGEFQATRRHQPRRHGAVGTMLAPARTSPVRNDGHDAVSMAAVAAGPTPPTQRHRRARSDTHPTSSA
jgi:2,4-dienoyl-CoA reductase-like NADH-dependent reductase (Old Yellow Enzyme family)